MSERTLVDYVLRGMRRRWDGPVKHADGFTAGVADLSGYILPVGTVWIECKAKRAWPKRPDTKVVLGLDDLQKEFLLSRRGWLFARIGREYLLWDYNAAYWMIDSEYATRPRMQGYCIGRWNLAVNWEEFSTIVRQHPAARHLGEVA